MAEQQPLWVRRRRCLEIGLLVVASFAVIFVSYKRLNVEILRAESGLFQMVVHSPRETQVDFSAAFGRPVSMAITHLWHSVPSSSSPNGQGCAAVGGVTANSRLELAWRWHCLRSFVQLSQSRKRKHLSSLGLWPVVPRC